MGEREGKGRGKEKKGEGREGKGVTWEAGESLGVSPVRERE